MDVLSVDRLAGDLRLSVETLEGPADIGEVGGALERGVLRDLEFRRRLGEVAKSPALAGLVRQHALGDDDLARRHAPDRRRRRDQHGARDGTRLSILKERIGDRRRAAGCLEGTKQQIVVLRCVGGGELSAHLLPVGVELLGDKGRKSGGDPLSLIEMLDQNGDGVVGRDSHEGVRREGLDRSGGGEGKIETNDEPDPGSRCDLDESAARRLNGHGAHPFMISAAR